MKALSTYAALLARAIDLYRVGNGCADIAAILNQEAWRPPKRRDTFNAPMVRRLLTTAGVIEPGLRRIGVRLSFWAAIISASGVCA